MLINLTAFAKLCVVLSAVSCVTPNIFTPDAPNLLLEYKRELLETRSHNVDFIKTLTEEELKEITNGHRYLLESLNPTDVEIMQVETCGYAIYNGEFMKPSTINAASKECVENFITRIPAGVSPNTVAIIPVNWFKLAGDKLLTAILSVDPSNLICFNKEVIEYIGTNPDGLYWKIPVESLINLPRDLKKLLKPKRSAEVDSIVQSLFYSEEFHENTPPSSHNESPSDTTLEEMGINQVDNSTEEILNVNGENFLNSLWINESYFLNSDAASRNSSTQQSPMPSEISPSEDSSAVTIQENQSWAMSSFEDDSALNIQDIQSSAISFPEHPSALPVNVPIAKTKRSRSRKNKNNKNADGKEEKKKVENNSPLKEGDLVMQLNERIGNRPFVVVKICDNKRLIISDCMTGKYKRQIYPEFIRKCTKNEIIPCPVFKLKEKVVVQRENGKLVGPFVITAIDMARNFYFLSEHGLNIKTNYFLVPWKLLRHYEINKINDYVKEKLEGEGIKTLLEFKAGDTIIVPEGKTQKDDIEIEVQTTSGLRSNGTIAVTSTKGQKFIRPFTLFYRIRDDKKVHE